MGPVLSILQTVNLDLYNNFIGKAMFISFTGDWLIEKTRPVFEQLVKDLVNHAYMATEYVSQAVIDLQKLMFNSGKRNVGMSRINLISFLFIIIIHELII